MNVPAETSCPADAVASRSVCRRFGLALRLSGRRDDSPEVRGRNSPPACRNFGTTLEVLLRAGVTRLAPLFAINPEGFRGVDAVSGIGAHSPSIKRGRIHYALYMGRRASMEGQAALGIELTRRPATAVRKSRGDRHNATSPLRDAGAVTLVIPSIG